MFSETENFYNEAEQKFHSDEKLMELAGPKPVG